MAVQDILVATDFRPGSREALEQALHSFGTEGGKLYVLHVVEQRLVEHTLSLYPETTEAALFTRLQEQAHERYRDMIQGIEMGRVEIEPLVVQGIPFLKIVQLARDLDVDMIVMTVHHGPAHLEQFLFGSTAERVMRITPCSVLIVPDKTSLREAQATS